MPNYYASGRNAEYQAMKELETDGWEVIRSAGSHGPWDLIAWDETKIRFIQVKRIARKQAFKRLIAELEEEILPPTGRAELWIRLRGNTDWYKKIKIVS